jgi:hypothetical protein
VADADVLVGRARACAAERDVEPYVSALLDGMADEVGRLRDALRAARAELDRWGWGDFHYGPQPRDGSVVRALAAIDAALGDGGPRR